MKINIGVIFGGKSLEHEISIISAIETMGYLDNDKYKIIPMYLDKENILYTGEHLKQILHYRDIKLVKRYAKKVKIVKEEKRILLQTTGLLKHNIATIDIIFPIGHGSTLEDGTIQGYLKYLDIPFVGSNHGASFIGMDKVIQKQLFKANELPITNYVHFTDYDWDKKKNEMLEKIKSLKYPLFVKPACLGSSIGIKKVEKEQDLNKAIKDAFNFGNKVIIEQAVKNLKEINISVLGDYTKQEVSEVEQICCVDEFYSFKEKYIKINKTNANKKQIKPLLSKEMLEDMKEYSKQIFKMIDANGLIRIDFLVDDKNKKIYVNEVNTIPGSLSFYLWLAKKKMPSELLDNLIDLAIKDYQKQKEYTTSFKGNLLEGYDKLKGNKIKK